MQHAEALYKKGINVLEDSSNWDWDESEQLAVSRKGHTFSALLIKIVNTKCKLPFLSPELRPYWPALNIALARAEVGSPQNTDSWHSAQPQKF